MHRTSLVEWEPDSLRSIQDSARATLVACNTIGECTTVTRWVVLDLTTGILAFTGMPFENSGRVFGAPHGGGDLWRDALAARERALAGDGFSAGPAPVAARPPPA